MLAEGCVVAVGVSGGKDSQACAFAVARYLDHIGHRGPRVLVHSDLGRAEWRDSLPACERLAAGLRWELMVVRRRAGDMLDRWQSRWESCVERYANLECVKLILPWSTPQMRFCTAELKVDQITSALKKRFPSHPILNASGIRREESATRSRMPVSAPMAKLQRRGLAGVAWNPIIDYTVADVWNAIASSAIEPHHAYARHGMRRVSCRYCIMSSEDDLIASSTCEDNHEHYRDLVRLEARSTFAFQGGRWLADVAPHLLDDALARAILVAKAAAKTRMDAESEIPPHLLYTKGWPSVMPMWEEASLLGDVRRRVAAAVGIEVLYTQPDDILQRYATLMAKAPGAPTDIVS